MLDCGPHRHISLCSSRGGRVGIQSSDVSSTCPCYCGVAATAKPPRPGHPIPQKKAHSDPVPRAGAGRTRAGGGPSQPLAPPARRSAFTDLVGGPKSQSAWPPARGGHGRGATHPAAARRRGPGTAGERGRGGPGGGADRGPLRPRPAPPPSLRAAPRRMSKERRRVTRPGEWSHQPSAAAAAPVPA